MKNTFAWLPLLVALLGCNAATAQDFPTRPIRVVVPFPAGGTADVLPRILAEKLRTRFPAGVVVENKPGAGGNIGAELVSKAEPDGHTLLAAPPGPIAINQSLYPKLAYDATRFVPVTVMAAVPNVLAVSNKLPVKNVQEFIAYLKANPGKVAYASQGNGSLSHIGTEIFKQQSGTFMTHIPYRGSGPVVADVLAGQVQVFITTPPSVMQHVVSGKLKAFAVTGTKRHPGLPNVPTVAEAGMPDFKLEAWVGLFAPAATPPAVVAKLTADVKKALDMPETRQRADAAGIELRYLPPDALGELVKTETAYWAKTIKAAGIKAD